jgi:hypothetical protein
MGKGISPVDARLDMVSTTATVETSRVLLLKHLEPAPASSLHPHRELRDAVERHLLHR